MTLRERRVGGERARSGPNHGNQSRARRVPEVLKKERPHGQEDRWHDETAGACRSSQPSPPVGPALGQRGINIMEFCKAFNAKTQELEPGAPCPTVITYYQDKSFAMDIKTPPASYFLKKAAKLKSGANNPSREIVGSVTTKQLREIAEAKMKDLNATDIDGAMMIIAARPGRWASR